MDASADSGSRVTRSLRKRLTSIDSDNSSRPATPLAVKLTSITEIPASPSRATRSSRRNSTTGVATPVKTPAKRGNTGSVTADHSEASTPARRSTRRSSIFTNENEEPSQTVIKIPSVGILDEEALQIVEKSETADSNSNSSRKSVNVKKSPSPKNSSKKRKPGPKSKTQKRSILENELQECQSDVEVSVIGNQIEDLENKSDNMSVLISSDNDSLTDSLNIRTEDHENKTPCSLEAITGGEDSFNKKDLDVEICQEQKADTLTDDNNIVEVPETTSVINSESENSFNKKDLDVEKICQEQKADTLTDDKNIEEVPETTAVINSESENESQKEKTEESLHGDLEVSTMNDYCATDAKKLELESFCVGQKNDTLRDDESLKVISQEIKEEKADQSANDFNSENMLDNQENNFEPEKQLEEKQFQIVLDNHKDQTLEILTADIEQQEVAVQEENSEEPKVVLIYQETQIEGASTLTDCKSLDVNKSPEKVEILSVETIAADDCEKILKKVEFSTTPSKDTSIKNVYPKTPVSAKVNPCKEIKSPSSISSPLAECNFENNGIEISQANKNDKSSKGSVLKNSKICSIPEIVYNNTLIGSELFKNNDSVQADEKDDVNKDTFHELENEEANSSTVIATENLEIDTACQEEKNLKWINPSVKGDRVEGSKLDVVLPKAAEENIEKLCSQEGKNAKSFVENEEQQDENDCIGEETITQDENECDEEENSFEKHDFIDDEAMEVDNYESGDSMDSEERREMEDNEIPVDAESIGSHSTDESQNENAKEEEEEESLNSFIVSDSEEDLDNSGSECNDYDEIIIEAPKKHKLQKSKKIYTRIQRPMADSSSSDEEKDEEKGQNVSKGQNNPEYISKNEISTPEKGQVIDEISANNSKSRTDRSLSLVEQNSSPNKSRLHYTSYSKSDEESNEEDINSSRKEILSKLNHSERFNKSVRDLNLDSDRSALDSHNTNEDIPHEKNARQEIMSSSIDGMNTEPEQNIKYSMENQLGEISVTSDSDAESENKDSKSGNGLSVSFGNFKKRKQKPEWQRSFTIDVTVKDGELKTAITNAEEENESNLTQSTDDQEKIANNEAKYLFNKKLGNIKEVPIPMNYGMTTEKNNTEHQKRPIFDTWHREEVEEKYKERLKEVEKGNTERDTAKCFQIHMNEAFFTSSSDDQEKGNTEHDTKKCFQLHTNEAFLTSSSDDKEEEEAKKINIEKRDNIRNVPLPLGNPLIRVRRQSLALPTNPDMEIFSSNFVRPKNKKMERRSLGVFPKNDFNPSQSFIENIERIQNEQRQLHPKRKRLSKSFGGSTEAHDNSIIDVDMSHLNKKGKVMDENSSIESDQEFENDKNTNKLSPKLSSTPHERISKNGSSSQHILARCDEILDAANRAKLEAKLKYKKNKTKISKKRIKKSAEESSPEDKFVSVPKDIKNKEKTKAAISQAILAADAILTKTEVTACKKGTLKRLDLNIIETPQKSVATKKRIMKEHPHQKKKTENIFATSAGNVTEAPQTPVKKKKLTYIQLPTGKVSVEPLTPKKHLVESFDGKAFKESPITPFVGFKVRKLTPENYAATLSLFRASKRKRSHDESLKGITGSCTQWTQSGIFTEEIISNQSTSSKKAKNRKVEKTSSNETHNFKENALSRSDINRFTKQELLRIKERNRGRSSQNKNI